MDSFAKAVISVLQSLLNFFDMSGGADRYVLIKTGSADQKQIVPFARKDVPNLGEDHEKLVAQAERLYETDDLRYKWLMAVHKVRQTKAGWILDPVGKRSSPPWGLTHRAV